MVREGGKVIIALDNMNRESVKELVSNTQAGISENVLFKLNDLLSFEGMKGVKEILKELGEGGIDTNMIQLMLDPKWNDIPNTIENYLVKLNESGLGDSTKLLTLMAGGGYKMMKAAVNKRDELGLELRLLAVTALTTLGNEGTQRIYGDNVKHTVLKLAKDALNAGMDGIVCSPQEATMLRSVFGNDFLIVTPGIRMEDNKVTNDDQKRIDTPDGAIRNGSTHLVIGRPITQAINKSAALLEILNLIDGVTQENTNNEYEEEKILYNGTMEEILKHIGAIYIRPHNGKYVRLASGLLSNGYVNIGVSERNPYILERVSNELTNQLHDAKIEADIVLGAQMGSVRLSSHLAKAMGIQESIYTEKEDNDLMDFKRHDINLQGKKVIISEDVITKATTTKQMINLVKRGGGEVTAITCLANRTGTDSIDGTPLFATYTPNPFELYYDNKTPENVKNNNSEIPKGSQIEEKPKNNREELVKSMK